MSVFIWSFGIFALAIVALGAGLLLGRGPLRPSSGGDSTLNPCRNCPRQERP